MTESLAALNTKLHNHIIDPAGFPHADHSGIFNSVEMCWTAPRSIEEVQHIVAVANETQTPILPRGAGTCTTGGASVVTPGIGMSFHRMNRILEIDTQNRTATVQPGVILSDLQRAVEAVGLFYPPDPASLDRCTIGGNVAENAGGPRCLKYGVTGDYVLGLSGVYGNGTPFKLGGKLLKNVAGLDIMRLIIGSEGRLAIVTEIILKLLPAPAERRLGLGRFDSVSEAVTSLANLRQSGLQPAAAEFFDARCVAAVLRANPDLAIPAATAYLVIELDDPSDTMPPHFEPTTDSIWEIRRQLSPALRAWGGDKFSHDITVPIATIPTVLSTLNKLETETGYTLVAYGHMGDGNLHVNGLKGSHSDTEWARDKPMLESKILELAVSLGGTISGEHGIGLTKRQYLPLMFGPQDLNLMSGIAQLFDPAGILNPTKAL